MMRIVLAPTMALLAGCAGTFAERYRLYEGPAASKDAVAIVSSKDEPSLWIVSINGDAAPKSAWDGTFSYELLPGTYVLDFTSAKHRWTGARSVRLEARPGRRYRVGEVPGGVAVSDVTENSPEAPRAGDAPVVRVSMTPPAPFLSAAEDDLASMAVVSLNGEKPTNSWIPLRPGRQELVLRGHRAVIKSLELTFDDRGKAGVSKLERRSEPAEARIAFGARPGGRYRLSCGADGTCSVSDQLERNKVVSSPLR